jgi:hypothetical protein
MEESRLFPSACGFADRGRTEVQRWRILFREAASGAKRTQSNPSQNLVSAQLAGKCPLFDARRRRNEPIRLRSWQANGGLGGQRVHWVEKRVRSVR